MGKIMGRFSLFAGGVLTARAFDISSEKRYNSSAGRFLVGVCLIVFESGGGNEAAEFSPRVIF
jgi:hypothetical protein